MKNQAMEQMDFSPDRGDKHKDNSTISKQERSGLEGEADAADGITGLGRVNRCITSSHIEKLLGENIKTLVAEVEKSSESNDLQYELLIRCASSIAGVDDQIKLLYGKLQEAFAPRFPELETLIFNPIDYARVAKLAATERDISKINLQGILPSGTAITVQLTASSSAGRFLKDDELRLVFELCHDITKLDENRTRLLLHVERNAAHMAPNLVVITGGAVAAKLIGYAGGLKELAQMPSSSVKLLGKQKKSLQGASTSTVRLHEGVIHTCPLVISLAKQYRRKAGDVTAGKAVLAARVDLSRQNHDASAGISYRKALEAKFEKWMEPPPARTLKPLPIPGDEAKKRHRGGKRARKEKERLGLTEMRRLANRVAFGEKEQEGEIEGEGLGMLGAEGSNAMRLKPKKSTSITAASKRKLEKQKKKEAESEAQKMNIVQVRLFEHAHDVCDEDVERNKVVERSLPTGRLGPKDRSKTSSRYFSASTPFLAAKRRRTDSNDTKRNEELGD